jgi:phospholipid/cholesterol/gamma-HCH transport system substrate-binding protein
MLHQRLIETLVGLFLLFALMALTILAFKVSGLTSLFPSKTYSIMAEFDDIGGLKVRSPVKIGGVQVGEVSAITLDDQSFKAVVRMKINQQFNDIPDDSSAGIYTAGLLGDNYVAITPMYNTSFLKEGSMVEYTNSAMVLEKLIGQLIYKVSGDSGGKEGSDKSATQKKN